MGNSHSVMKRVVIVKLQDWCLTCSAAVRYSNQNTVTITITTTNYAGTTSALCLDRYFGGWNEANRVAASNSPRTKDEWTTRRSRMALSGQAWIGWHASLFIPLPAICTFVTVFSIARASTTVCLFCSPPVRQSCITPVCPLHFFASASPLRIRACYPISPGITREA